MNKREIDRLLPKAYEAIKAYQISDKDNNLSKTFRGQISAFGASVSMGSLLSAVAFFSAKGSSEVERPRLMKAVYELMTGERLSAKDDEDREKLFFWVKDNPRAL